MTIHSLLSDMSQRITSLAGLNQPNFMVKHIMAAIGFKYRLMIQYPDPPLPPEKRKIILEAIWSL